MNKRKVHIRGYLPDDYEEYEEVTQLWGSLELGRPERGDNQEVIENTLKKGGKLFIAEIQGAIVATAWVTDNGRRLYLHHMGVAAHEQGRGIGKKVMEEVLRFAAFKEMQIKLEVHASNIAARKLYEKYGFSMLQGYQVLINRDTQ
jgi:ribosomal protein S18 acetylase RimI-like enzyme